MLDVLQVLLAEVDHRDALRQVVSDQSPSRLREQDLAAVAGRADTRGPHDVEPEVALLADRRLARVEAHPHLDLGSVRPLVLGERPLCRDRARDAVPRARERVEERVALGVDLGPALLAEVLPQQLPVIADDVTVGVSELLEQSRRAFDVGEEKGDGAARERSHGRECRLATK